jgi:biuret amidohydrolase
MAEHIDSPQTLPNWIMPWPEFGLDWSRAALIVVDYQNYACNPNCGLAGMIAQRHPEVAEYYLARLSGVAIPNTLRLVRAFRESGRDVVYTRHGPWLPDGRDMISRRRRRDAASVAACDTPQLWGHGSFEHEIIEALRPQRTELVIDKNCSSPFNGTGIDQLLRNMGLDTLVMAGVATDMCVETTARDAADRGYNVIAVEDATASFFHAHHIAALSALARVYAQVWDTHRVLLDLTRSGQ